jgi:predicted RNA-binding Zn-ribbon protein involved in translation (DUF1610 family)
MTKPKYKIDLCSTDDKGRFPCPKCGTEINPTVKNTEIYDVVEVRMRGDMPYSAILDCNKCGSEIELKLTQN